MIGTVVDVGGDIGDGPVTDPPQAPAATARTRTMVIGAGCLDLGVSTLRRFSS
jgi:hypothetical protein